MDFDLEVKKLIVSLGWRHRNRPVEVRSLGNSVDTIRRRATFRFAVRWAKVPSQALIEGMSAGTSPLPPTTQAYATDVDCIDIELHHLTTCE